MKTPIEAEKHSTRRTLSRRRRWAYRLMTLGVILVGCEMIAIAVLVVRDRRVDFWAVNQDLRDQIRAPQKISAPGEGDAPEIHARFDEFSVHPYLGFTLDPTKVQNVVSQYGFVNQYYYDIADQVKRRISGDNLPRRETGRVIVAIVGGSVAGGFAHQGMPTLLEELQSSNAFRGKEFLVVPLAQGGFKQPQQLLTMIYLLSLGAEFDVVINLDGFNEVALHDAENGLQDIFYAYPRAWSQFARLLPGRTAQRLQASAYEYQRRRQSWADRGSISPLRYSAVYNVVWRLGDSTLETNLRDIREEFRQHRSTKQLPYQVLGPECRYANDEEVYRDLVGIWERCSLQLHYTCASNDIKYFHFLQPNQYVQGSKPMSAAEREVAIREGHPYRAGAEAGYPLLQEAGARLQARGVPFHDLTRAFEQHHDPLYNDDCCHFSKEGQQILARHMADAIVAMGMPVADSKSRPAVD